MEKARIAYEKVPSSRVGKTLSMPLQKSRRDKLEKAEQNFRKLLKKDAPLSSAEALTALHAPECQSLLAQLTEAKSVLRDAWFNHRYVVDELGVSRNQVALAVEASDRSFFGRRATSLEQQLPDAENALQKAQDAVADLLSALENAVPGLELSALPAVKNVAEPEVIAESSGALLSSRELAIRTSMSNRRGVEGAQTE
jgi:hypothetical protein